MTVNTNTVKTIVPKVQFPNTWKTRCVATCTSVHLVQEEQKRRQWQRCKQGQGGEGGMARLLLGPRAGRSARQPPATLTLCHALPRTSDPVSWQWQVQPPTNSNVDWEHKSFGPPAFHDFLVIYSVSAFSWHRTIAAPLVIVPFQSHLQDAPVGASPYENTLVCFADTSDYAQQRKADTVYKSKWWQWMGQMLTKGCQDLNAYIKTESEM